MYVGASVDGKDAFAVCGDIIAYAIASLGMPEQFAVSGVQCADTAIFRVGIVRKRDIETPIGGSGSAKAVLPGARQPISMSLRLP